MTEHQTGSACMAGQRPGTLLGCWTLFSSLAQEEHKKHHPKASQRFLWLLLRPHQVTRPLHHVTVQSSAGRQSNRVLLERI